MTCRNIVDLLLYCQIPFYSLVAISRADTLSNLVNLDSQSLVLNISNEFDVLILV